MGCVSVCVCVYIFGCSCGSRPPENFFKYRDSCGFFSLSSGYEKRFLHRVHINYARLLAHVVTLFCVFCGHPPESPVSLIRRTDIIHTMTEYAVLCTFRFSGHDRRARTRHELSSWKCRPRSSTGKRTDDLIIAPYRFAWYIKYTRWIFVFCPECFAQYCERNNDYKEFSFFI